MGLRFRKSMKLLPGVRLNFNLHSMSITAGPKGFHQTYSTTGRVTRSVGIPGTGISYVTTSGGGRNAQRNSRTGNSLNLVQSQNYSVPVENNIATRNAVRQAEQERRKTEDQNRKRSSALQYIYDIYQVADPIIDWRRILITDSNDMFNDEEWNYLKPKAELVLNGDIDTYFQIISDMNPFSDLQELGNDFEFGSNDPRMLHVEFDIKSKKIIRDAKILSKEEYNLILQDYVCGVAIRVARDLFSLLPLRNVCIDVYHLWSCVLSVNFIRDQFMKLDFSQIDASDTIESFDNNMIFDQQNGFRKVRSLLT